MPKPTRSTATMTVACRMPSPAGTAAFTSQRTQRGASRRGSMRRRKWKTNVIMIPPTHKESAEK